MWSRTPPSRAARRVVGSGFLRENKPLTEMPQRRRERRTRRAHLGANHRLCVRESGHDVLEPLVSAPEAAFVLCEEERGLYLPKLISDRLGLLMKCLEGRRHKLHIGESLPHLLSRVLVDPATGHLGDAVAHEGVAALACELD